MNQLIITRLYPEIHCHTKKLMLEDIQRRKERGENVSGRRWVIARADEANMSAHILTNIIFNKRSYRGYEEELVKIFGKEVFTVEWKPVKD